MKLARVKFLILSGALLIGVPFFVHSTTYGWQWEWRRWRDLSREQYASVSRLQEAVRVLAGDIGVRDQYAPARLADAANYIARTFTELGYQVSRQKFTVRGEEFENIIADFPEAAADAPVILLGAHYDSHRNPGADDNASGVAALLELARLLRDQPFRARVTFVAFANEEPPFFMTADMGSYVYARQAREEQQDIRAVIVLETIGYYSRRPFSQRYLAFMGPFYPNSGDFVAVVGNFPSGRLVDRLFRGMRRSRLAKVEKLTAPEFVPGVYFSDHWSFWQHDYPAVMVTDTAFLRNPYYHSEGDLPSTLDYEALARTVWALRDALTELEQQAHPKSDKEGAHD